MRTTREHPGTVRARALALYRAGNSGPRVARTVGLPYTTVRYWLRKAGVARNHSESALLRFYSDRHIDGVRMLDRYRRIVEMYQTGAPWREIQRAFRCSVSTIKRALDTFEVTYRSELPTPHSAYQESDREIARLYRNGVSWREIVRMVGCSKYTLRQALAREGVACERSCTAGLRTNNGKEPTL